MMPSRKQPLRENALYHVFNRGYDKHTIFFEDKDYKRFVDTMGRYLDEYEGITIYARSLLPNHFHLVISSSKSGLEISHFMRKIQQAYSMYFKAKYRAISPDLEILKYPRLFSGRFKAKEIDSEEYLEQAILYVGLNPLKHGIVDDIVDWPYTSYVGHDHDDNANAIKSGLEIIDVFADWEF